MLKLYYTPGTCSLAPHIALEETGERYELARVDLAANQQNSSDFMRLNPKGRVPVLTDGDWALTEAPAILRYIAARHPAAGLWPWDPREEARCAEWLGWLSSTVHVGAGYVRRAARYASDPRAVEDVAATGRKTCRALWEAVEQGIGPGRWAIGERYSVADPYLLVYWLWGRSPLLNYEHGARFSALDRARAPHGAPPGRAARVRYGRLAVAELEHDPEKWNPVFRKDHAPPD
jgi:glutathione S-transferase